MTHPRQHVYDRQVALWLVFCAAVVFGMILLGAVTRLTGSGLSMVEWQPLMGVVPPLSQEAWQDTFAKYQLYPEYQQVNRHMDLEGFKRIFLFEYLHRLLGRLIGVLFFFPMICFWLRGRLRPGLAPHLCVLFLLGGLQGLLGWYMVQSGLVDNPRVSQYRLAAHLGLAVAIYAWMLWLVFELLMPGAARTAAPVARARSLARDVGDVVSTSKPAPVARARSLAPLVLVYLMILSGALVAGTRAGFAYPTWPLMGDSFIPPGLYQTTPAWLAAFEDITTVQFNHRLFAYALFVLLHACAFSLYLHARGSRERLAAVLVVVALWLQVALGIGTLVLHVPVALATAHQGGAVLLLSTVLFAMHARWRA